MATTLAYVSAAIYVLSLAIILTTKAFVHKSLLTGFLVCNLVPFVVFLVLSATVTESSLDAAVFRSTVALISDAVRVFGWFLLLQFVLRLKRSDVTAASSAGQ